MSSPLPAASAARVSSAFPPWQPEEPAGAGLPGAGYRMLAILAFAVIIWMTEAIDYAVSAIVIAGLILWILLDGRARQRDIAGLEASGVRRRSAQGKSGQA